MKKEINTSKVKSEFRLFGLPIFQFNKEERSLPVDSGTLKDPTQKLKDAITSVGKTEVTQTTVLGISAAWRAINVISSTLAGLPLKHFDHKKDERIALDSDLYKLLKKPNRNMTGFIFREAMTAMAVGHGNAYAVIKRDIATAKAIELMPVHPSVVDVFKTPDGEIWYRITDVSLGFSLPVSYMNMLHIPGLSFNGLKGFSPITIARESFEGIIATQKFGNIFYENGAHLGGVLETDGVLNDATYERLKQSWEERYQGIDNTGKPAILEGGLKYSKIQIAPEEAQFLETRQFQVAEIARWFGVPPHMLMDLERSTNNNIEHQGMEFVQYTLHPWAKRWEGEIERKLIPSTNETEYVEHQFNGLMRADAKSRAEMYRSLFGIGVINPNNIAQLENLPKPDNGEKHYIQGAYVPTDKIGDFYLNKTKTNNNGKAGD